VPVIPPGGANHIDVADVVAGHIAAAERGNRGERYVLGAHNLTHRKLGTIIAQVVGVEAPRREVPRTLMAPLALGMDLFNRIWPGEPLADGNVVLLMKHQLYYDTSKAQRELGLGSPIPFAATVERTFHWYRENGYL
jgi:dihydroflavonol-4-reductase